jgi:predicted dehydrogenase
MKAAIVGLGGIAPMHIKPLKTIGVEIVAVCDIKSELSEKVAMELNCRGFTNYEEMLEVGGFDVLHICLPHYLHAPVSIVALQKGFHVLTEKPISTTIPDAEKMLEVCQKSGKALGVIFQNRYNPGVILIKETLESGELGAVTGGYLRVNWHRTNAYYESATWRATWEQSGGGAVIAQAIHSFDLMNYLIGNPTEVYASMANRVHPKIEVEDVAEGIITYGNAFVSFFVNTFHPYDEPVSMRISCENGYASLVGDDVEVVYNDGRKKVAGADLEAQKLYSMKSYWGVSHIKQITDFYESIKAGETPIIDGVEALRTQRLIDAIYKSAKTGRKVTL